MRHRFAAAPNGIRDDLFIRHGELIMMVLYTSVVYSPDLALVPELAATAGQRLAAIELG
jgi:hypothetical protein